MKDVTEADAQTFSEKISRVGNSSFDIIEFIQYATENDITTPTGSRSMRAKNFFSTAAGRGSITPSPVVKHKPAPMEDSENGEDKEDKKWTL